MLTMFLCVLIESWKEGNFSGDIVQSRRSVNINKQTNIWNMSVCVSTGACFRWCAVSPDPSQKTDWNLCTTINFLGATDKSRSWYLRMLVSLRYERRRPSVRQRSNNCLRYAIFRAGWVKGGHLLENYFSFFTRASADKYTHFLFIVSNAKKKKKK